MAPPRLPVVDRLLAKREVVQGCWIWVGSCTRDGYGVMTVGRNNQRRVHRLSYEHFVGAIPGGMLVCHSCDNPKCFNPNHLFLGSARENTQDMIQKGRKVVLSGVLHPNTKIPHGQREVIRRRRASGDSLKLLAADYGVSFQLISAICRKVRNYAAG